LKQTDVLHTTFAFISKCAADHFGRCKRVS